MKHRLKESFKRIIELILAEKKSLQEWAEIESDDMFQEDDYTGGFDATEMEFCFAVIIDDKEYWFQLSLAEIELTQQRELSEIDIRPADK